MLAALIEGVGANDVITALLLVAISAVIRGLWNIQQRVSRLEGVDEMRERVLNMERGDEGSPSGESVTLPRKEE